jgi:hypothetical protein
MPSALTPTIASACRAVTATASVQLHTCFGTKCGKEVCVEVAGSEGETCVGRTACPLACAVMLHALRARSRARLDRAEHYPRCSTRGIFCRARSLPSSLVSRHPDKQRTCFFFRSASCEFCECFGPLLSAPRSHPHGTYLDPHSRRSACCRAAR